VPWINRRTLLTICVGVLLPLPLVLLWGSLFRPELEPEVLAGTRIVPVLDGEQRARLMTYHRRCVSTEECDPPLGCLYQYRYGQSFCTDSQCTVDAQCPEGQVCRGLATERSELLVRACVPVGPRREGDSCVKLPAKREDACSAELLCAGMSGWCARPCHLGKPNECPEGFFCADIRPQSACLPTCEKSGCPAGQHCVQFPEGSSACAHVYGTNCQQTPCPGGEHCLAFSDPPRPGKAWLHCVERCGKDLPPCPDGKFCDGYECVPACDPQGPSVCAEGYRCRQPWPDDPFGCHPDW